MFRSLLWFYKNECKGQSNCINDQTFRHSNLVSSSQRGFLILCFIVLLVTLWQIMQRGIGGGDGEMAQPFHNDADKLLSLYTVLFL